LVNAGRLRHSDWPNVYVSNREDLSKICTILTSTFWFTGIELFSSDLTSEFFLMKRSDAFEVASGEVAQMTQNAHLQDSAESGKPRGKVISIQ
jgi:hypothetical protein